MNSWELILETDNFVVDYDKSQARYRVSYFENNHFVDEIVFDAPECPMGCVGTLSKYDLA